MKKYTLAGQLRNVTGRKVRKLRTAGQIPATVYGKAVKSINICIPQTEFQSVFAQAGETGLVELTVSGLVRPVLIHNVQRDPVLATPLHVEFFQVDLKTKVHANVPVELIGDAPAVVSKTGVLLTITDEIEVEALPAQLPEKITIDVSHLTEINQEMKVSDLPVPTGVTILTDPGQTIIKLGALVSRAAEAEAAAEAAAAAEAKAAEAPAEVVPTGEESGAKETPETKAPTEEMK